MKQIAKTDQIEYKGSMKIKTSITLSSDLLKTLDRMERGSKNRSRLIEEAVIFFLAQKKRARRDAKDLKIMNEEAESINQEAEDALTYQVAL